MGTPQTVEETRTPPDLEAGRQLARGLREALAYSVTLQQALAEATPEDRAAVGRILTAARSLRALRQAIDDAADR